MDKRVWYEALALMANGSSHHHVFYVASSLGKELVKGVGVVHD